MSKSNALMYSMIVGFGLAAGIRVYIAWESLINLAWGGCQWLNPPQNAKLRSVPVWLNPVTANLNCNSMSRSWKCWRVTAPPVALVVRRMT